jgi:hypothetical protein
LKEIVAAEVRIVLEIMLDADFLAAMPTLRLIVTKSGGEIGPVGVCRCHGRHRVVSGNPIYWCIIVGSGGMSTEEWRFFGGVQSRSSHRNPP